MTEPEIYAALTELFRELFDDPKLVLHKHTTARQVRGWDSAKTIGIIMAVEQRFGFAMKSREMDRLTSIGDFVALIRAKTAAVGADARAQHGSAAAGAERR
jgi:acyl carrier protein